MKRFKLLGLMGLMAAIMTISVLPLTAGAQGTSNTTTLESSSGEDFHVIGLGFSSATQTFQYYIDVSGATGPLKVQTRDCCIAGDKWGVVLVDIRNPGSPLPPVGTFPRSKVKCGTGSTSSYTGTTSLGSSSSPFNGRALAIIFYCEGVDTFGAGMDFRVTTTGAHSVTARAAGGP